MRFNQKQQIQSLLQTVGNDDKTTFWKTEIKNPQTLIKN